MKGIIILIQDGSESHNDEVEILRESFDWRVFKLESLEVARRIFSRAHTRLLSEASAIVLGEFDAGGKSTTPLIQDLLAVKVRNVDDFPGLVVGLPSTTLELCDEEWEDLCDTLIEDRTNWAELLNELLDSQGVEASLFGTMKARGISMEVQEGAGRSP